jgi:hypothetical protein
MRGVATARLLAALALAGGALAPTAGAHVLKLSFARARSVALLHTIERRQHADGGKITTCYRVSEHAVRCGLTTWKRSGPVRWTCYGHVNSFFAPVSSHLVSTQSRGVYCKS